MGKLTRRTFLQIGATSAAGILLGDGMRFWVKASEVQEWMPTLAKLGEPIPTTCDACPAGCGLLCYLHGDELRAIFGNPAHPVNRGRLCAKGIAGLNVVFDPDRILYPMKRVGKRGQGHWKRITWDEAYHTLSSKLSSLLNEGRIDEAVFDLRREERLVTRFLDTLIGPTVLDRSRAGNRNKSLAHKVTWGVEQEVVDPRKSTYVLLFGSNPFEHHDFHVGLSQRLMEGKIDRGAKLVAFDVRLSNTAAKSDESFLIRPGTDGLIALAMAHVILQEGMHDVEFLEKWTTSPFNRLVNHLEQYPPERAALESGLSAADIRRIALEFARSKPAAVLSGGGVSEHPNGFQNERSVLLLAALTGNIDVQGGNCLPRVLPLSEPDPLPPQRSGEVESISRPSSLLTLLEQRGTIDFYLTGCSNPAYDDPENERTVQALKDETKISFSVAFETHLTESSVLADMVLPSATYLESYELRSPPSMEMRPFVTLRQPVLKRAAEAQFLKDGTPISSPPLRPYGEAQSLGDVCLEIAKRMGGETGRYFPFASAQEYLGALVSRIDGLRETGTMEYLEKHGFWIDSSKEPQQRTYQRHGFQTPSGKFEIFSSALERMGVSPLPLYQPIPAHRNLGDQEFILTTYTMNVHTNRTGNCKWLSEIAHDNPAWMNTQTAVALGLRRGDVIRITSHVGEVITRVFLTEGIHPRAVAIGQGCGHWEWGRIARAEKEKSRDADTDLMWWGKIGSGVHPNAIIPVLTDPNGGGQAWHDTRVTIGKV